MNPLDPPSPSDLPVSGPPSGPPSDSVITPSMRESLLGTRGSTKLVSILLFVIAGLIVLVAVGVIVSMLGGDGPGGLAGPEALIIVLIYGAGAAIQFALATYLLRFASGLEAFGNGSSVALEGAFEAQRRFWRIVAVIAGIYLVFLVLTIAAVFFGAIFAFLE